MGLFSSIGGLFGGNKAAKDQSKALQALAEQNRFQPFNISTPFSGGSFDGTTGKVTTGNKGLNTTFDDFGKLVNQTGARGRNFDAQSFQNDFFRSIDRLESQREAEGFGDFESSIFNKSGVSTGTGRQVRDFQESLQQRRFDRQQRAVEASQQFQSNIFNQFLGLNQGRNQLNSAVLDPLRLGIDAGRAASSANQQGNDFIKQGIDGETIATSNTGSTIGGILDAGFSLFGGGFF
jgi:hypothetical protein